MTYFNNYLVIRQQGLKFFSFSVTNSKSPRIFKRMEGLVSVKKPAGSETTLPLRIDFEVGVSSLTPSS